MCYLSLLSFAYFFTSIIVGIERRRWERERERERLGWVNKEHV
jgi:hypothetical protein